MNGLVSVIIGVYNCKPYLQRAFDSVREQSYRNLEVIMVDDCSTDGSGEFCDAYCCQDERFCVIHHELNKGAGAARNSGLRAAKGEYVYFMDGDDYIHAEAIEALLDAIKETGLDLAAFDLYWKALPKENTHCPRDKKPLEIVAPERMMYEMLSGMNLIWCVVWNKLYKRSLIDGLFFNDAYISEDQDFNIRLYQRIDRAAFIPEQLYWYVHTPNSLVNNPAHIAKRSYLNTFYRFKMMDRIQPGKNMKKYRAWIIGYGYLQILERRDIVKGTTYEADFKELSISIFKKTGKEFLFTRYFPVLKKVRFVACWLFPKLCVALNISK